MTGAQSLPAASPTSPDPWGSWALVAVPPPAPESLTARCRVPSFTSDSMLVTSRGKPPDINT
jgi:hypothetical protein